MFEPKNLAESIVLTMAYCDQFDFPLRKTEVWQRLIAIQPSLLKHQASRKISRTEFERSFKQVLQQKKLLAKNDFYYLPARQDLVQVRLRRAVVNRQKLDEVESFKQWVKWVPWIQAIFLTGSVAMENADVSNDIDFLIVTTPNRLWLTRLVVTALTLLKGKHRSWNGPETQKWCLNLWLDTNHLQVDRKKRSIYQAYEVTQARLIFQRMRTADRFYQENAWVKEFLPNSFTSLAKTSALESKPTSSPSSRLAFLGDVLEELAWQIQYFYMKQHLTSERVSRQYAFFHPRDTQRVVYDGWQQSLHGKNSRSK